MCIGGADCLISKRGWDFIKIVRFHIGVKKKLMKFFKKRLSSLSEFFEGHFPESCKKLQLIAWKLICIKHVDLVQASSVLLNVNHKIKDPNISQGQTAA